ncbi:hypothetical protein HYPGJ_20809 [Hyphomicrobium sp. GJ21]|nr:hypothetical protein HYPGJ_20809 [Hyphomicrobium sp. GJ21]
MFFEMAAPDADGGKSGTLAGFITGAPPCKAPILLSGFARSTSFRTDTDHFWRGKCGL